MGLEQPGRGTSELSRTMLAALPAALLLPLAAFAAFASRAVAPSPRFSTSATFAGLAAFTLFLLVEVNKHRRPRAGVLAACHALAWAPLLAACAWQSIDEPIVSRPLRGCATGLMAFLALAVPVGCVALLILGAAAGIVLVRRSTDRAIRSAAFVATGLAFVAFVFAAVRVARPDPDTYLASLERVADLRPGETANVGGRAYRYEMSEPKDKVPVRTMDGGKFLPASVECSLAGPGETLQFHASSALCLNLRIRLDRGHDIAVVDTPDMDYSPVQAFRPSTGETISISPSTVADHLAPPVGWTAGAGLGGLIGVAGILAARRLRRRAAAIDAREAKHFGGGLVELETGESLRIDAAAGLPLGPVVLGNVGEQLPTYRQIGAPTFGAASAGTLDEMRAKLTDLAASYDALAVAAALVGAAPLLVARLVAGL